MTATEHEDHADIRDAVGKLGAQFPGQSWRKLDREMAYPSEFVDALTQAGYLSVLIPEEYGGAGLKLSAAAAILEEIQRAGCNGGGCHAQMYTMGTLLRHGSDEQKAKWLPKVASGESRLQAFGVTEPSSGTDTSSLKTFAKREGNDTYIVNGQKIWTSRAEYSDLMILLARTTPKEKAKKRTDGLSVFIVDMKAAKGNGLSISPIRTMMNHSTTEVFFTDMKVPADASWEAANACVQTHGGFGFAEEYDVERKFRETRLYQVAPISTNLILSFVAEHVLGMPRSY